MNNNTLYSMKETSNITKLSYDTLKFYCNEGLIPNVKRNKSNYRVFDDNDINWIKNLICLRKCGMSIIEMKKYMNLCLKGSTSITERKDILYIKLNELENKRKEIEDSINYVNKKIKFYDDVLNKKEKYYSYLITCDKDI